MKWPWSPPPSTTRTATDPQRAPCDLCGGTGWASYPDPFFGGALIDARCPCCQDTTVRASKSRWEDNHGRRVGPT